MARSGTWTKTNNNRSHDVTTLIFHAIFWDILRTVQRFLLFSRSHHFLVKVGNSHLNSDTHSESHLHGGGMTWSQSQCFFSKPVPIPGNRMGTLRSCRRLHNRKSVSTIGERAGKYGQSSNAFFELMSWSAINKIHWLPSFAYTGSRL